VFAWDHIDPASHLLAEHLPADLDGAVADLGAGFGYLASEILQHCPNIAALDLYEADARALDLARQNLAQTSTGVQPGFHWHDVTTGLPRQYQHIVSNPPFHAQRSRQRIDIGQAFLAAAAAALLPGGQLWLVANRHLPYEALLADRFDEVRTLAQTGAYKVINARRAGGQRLQLRPRLRDQTDSSSEWRPRKRQQASDPGRRRR
jgi:16S rRNA (guanine1207-N2)-methyltransferase